MLLREIPRERDIGEVVGPREEDAGIAQVVDEIMAQNNNGVGGRSLAGGGERPGGQVIRNEGQRGRIVPVNVHQQVVTLKDALRMISEYDGQRIQIGRVLEGCDEAREMIGPEGEATLVKIARSRLLGEAERAIYGQTFATMKEFEEYIKMIFAPAKSVHQLQGE